MFAYSVGLVTSWPGRAKPRHHVLPHLQATIFHAFSHRRALVNSYVKATSFALVHDLRYLPGLRAVVL